MSRPACRVSKEVGKPDAGGDKPRPDGPAHCPRAVRTGHPVLQTPDVNASHEVGPGGMRPRLQIGLFATTLFTGATLLFWIQPLFTKMVLPVLGGSPAVWNTAMVFFQAMLLGGYLYAHVLGRLFRPGAQLVVHLACLALAAFALPVEPAEGWHPDAGDPPALWLLILLAGTIGAPFFAVSATAPLMLRWFSHTGHPHAGDPYFLYAASNVGSMVILLAYPFLVEPALGVRAQGIAWSGGFALLAACILGCGLFAARSDAPPPPAAAFASNTRPTHRQRLWWLAYSALPACLLLGVTGHITTDIASAPLLWVVPLALYLATFVNAFARRPLIPHGVAVRAMAWAVLLLAAVLPFREPAGVFLPLHLAVFFVVATACHLELARRRPPPEALTEFFCFVSLGGVLGGAFAGLVAPVVFPMILEYPLALVAAAALLPRPSRRVKAADIVIAALIPAVILGGDSLASWLDWPRPMIGVAALYAVLVALALSRQIRPLGFALCILSFVCIGLTNKPWGGKSDTLWRDRSFFGAYRVTESTDPPMVSLVHGTTNHGGQWIDADGALRPTTYHTAASPLAAALKATQAQTDRQRVGVVGLGSGAMAYYRRPGDVWRYFEIDPLIVRLAVDSGYFGMLAAHDPAPSIVLGDARLTLAREPERSFDVLVMEAFSSDAIPTHLLTREAVALYMDKLAPDGVLLLHISNRLLDLQPVAAAAAAELDYPAVIARSKRPDEADDPTYAPSVWVAVARTRETLDVLGSGWEVLEAPQARAWRDDHSSLVRAIRWTGR